MSEVQKIAQVISKCNDCKHSRGMYDQKDNSFFALLCDYKEAVNIEAPTDELIEDENPLLFEPFLIGTSSSDPKHTNWTIPSQCPLEDYTNGTSN